MGYRLSTERIDEWLAQLQEKYRIFAPQMVFNRGRQTVRYGEITCVSEIVLDVQSDFSPKEVFYPIIQTMFFINENEYRESSLDDDKDTILFIRPCDINGIKRLDTIFLENGGYSDEFYQRRRDKVKLFLMECRQGWDNCFCVSMGTNITDDYSVAVRFEESGVLVHVKNEEFTQYFQGESAEDFVPEYVLKNTKKVTLPVITAGNLQQVHGLEMWKDYNDKCLSCGGCNAVCGTCSCFDTADVIYDETSRSGERRRIWASCMQESYTTMAGGHKVRNSPGDRMRFKTLHKVYDFKSRFGGENMCVGCGRCENRCPEKISFSDTINKLNDEMRKLGGAK